MGETQGPFPWVLVLLALGAVLAICGSIYLFIWLITVFVSMVP